ncbi:MAG TPA: hypothetical protein DCM45_04155, partial [Clostridiales bacterium]|nr:hypothetical protein [Clostridiales bacterium]
MNHAEKVRLRENRELARLCKKRDKRVYWGYAVVLFILVCLIHVVDEVTTDIRGFLQSSVVNEFFVIGRGMTFNEGLASISSLSVISLALLFVNPFYATLADRFGRKIFLVINTLGMTVGLLLGFLSYNYAIYVLGVVISTFFCSHDMQVTYIMEVAPADKRAKYYGITKCIGTLGLFIVPLFRDLFIGNDATQWRLVFLIPAIISGIVCLLAVIGARETPTFLHRRIEYLEKPVEQRAAEAIRNKASKKASTKESGIAAGWKYIMSHKDIRWSMIASCIGTFAIMAMSSYYESIMSTNGMSTEDVTTALYFYPFIFAAVLAVNGFIGDKFGRKPTITVMSVIAIVGFILFVISSKSGWSPYLVGIFYGLY